MLLRLSSSVGAVLLFASTALANEELTDFLHTCLARKVLAEDPQLSVANVGVRVKDRVVVLWGPVSTAAHSQSAYLLLKARPEFIEVRNELVIVADDDGWAIPLTKADSWEHVMPRSSGVLAGRIENERPPVLQHTAPMKPLEQRVRELRELRSPYQSFVVTFEGRTLFVTAPSDAGETLQDFLGELSKLPGVERIVLKTNN